MVEAPFPPVTTIDTDGLITATDAENLLSARPGGVSLCVRFADGPNNRGGYFFHFRPSDRTPGELLLCEMDGSYLVELALPALVAFINHCTGRQFDEESFDLCQLSLNFRTDDLRGA